MSWDDDWEDDDLSGDYVADLTDLFDPTPRRMGKRLFEDRIIRGLRKPFSYLTLSDITREAARLFSNTNVFLASIPFEPPPAMTREMFRNSMIRKLDAWRAPKIGAQLRLRLPSNYKVR
jgi:hypothetical protein